VGVPLGNSSEEMVISDAESCGSVHDTLDAQAVAVFQGEAKLEINLGHHTLDGNWENCSMGLGLKNLDIVEENDRFPSMSTTSTSSGGRGVTHDNSD
jgi:hypothetical protein